MRQKSDTVPFLLRSTRGPAPLPGTACLGAFPLPGMPAAPFTSADYRLPPVRCISPLPVS